MMRFILFLLLLTAVSLPGLSQDVLHKTDDSKLEVQVLEISDSHIRYKLRANPTGPVYVISKQDVIKITYANGQVEIIPKSVQSAAVQPRDAEQRFTSYEDERQTDFGRNFISINLIDLVAEAVTVNYEHIFGSGELGIKVPLSIGFGNRNNYSDNTLGYYNRAKTFSTGIDLYYYPFGQGKVRYFVGPSFEYGQFKFHSTYYYPYPYQPPVSFTNSGSFRSVLIQNGFLMQPTKHFNISINAGIGGSNVSIKYPDYYNSVYYYGANTRLTARMGMNIGFKF